MNEISRLSKYYSTHDENSGFDSKASSVEFFTTMHYIEKYLKQDVKILEIGAASGRYSHALARQGYVVDAVELLPSNINVFIGNTLPCEKVSITQGNVCNLQQFQDNSYDIVLLLRSMYYLYSTEDQFRALSEAVRVTKSGGIIFVAYCGNDSVIVSNYFSGERLFRHSHYREDIVESNFKLPMQVEGFYIPNRIEDIDALNKGLPVERLHLVGTDMFSRILRDDIERMDESMWNLYLKYHFSICERKDMVGISTHFLDILQKLKT